MRFERPASLLATVSLLLVLNLAGCKSVAGPDDTILNSSVQKKLAADTALTGEPIQTFVQSGVVTLQGTVSSEAARALAANEVSQVSGIRSVVNQLTLQSDREAQAPLVHPAQPAVSTAVQGVLPSRPRKPSAIPQRRIGPSNPPEVSRSNAPSAPAPIERRDLRSDVSQQDSPRPPSETSQAPPPPSVRTVTVPAGTTLPIRITQTLDSATAQAGDAFSGTLASDIVLDGLVAFPAGTTVNGRVDEVHEAAHFKGSALLTLSLVSVSRRGERTVISTAPYTQEGTGRGKNTAEKVGGGAAVGAILGGIFGGGKGAAIGAAAGGGLGAGANGVTRGQQVQIPSETILRFRLTNAVEVRASSGSPAESDPSLQRHPGN